VACLGIQVGTSFALRNAVITEQMTSPANSSRTALETLVVAQLAAIRKRESELQNRLQSTDAFEPDNVAQEVWQLRTSADRLSRMMDAMNFCDSDAAIAV
jgi:hypothetical protein